MTDEVFSCVTNEEQGHATQEQPLATVCAHTLTSTQQVNKTPERFTGKCFWAQDYLSNA